MVPILVENSKFFRVLVKQIMIILQYMYVTKHYLICFTNPKFKVEFQNTQIGSSSSAGYTMHMLM